MPFFFSRATSEHDSKEKIYLGHMVQGRTPRWQASQSLKPRLYFSTPIMYQKKSVPEKAKHSRKTQRKHPGDRLSTAEWVLLASCIRWGFFQLALRGTAGSAAAPSPGTQLVRRDSPGHRDCIGIYLCLVKYLQAHQGSNSYHKY